MYHTFDHEQVPTADRVECTTEAGELIYIPEGWYHSTINLQETIGIARQHMHDMKVPREHSAM